MINPATGLDVASADPDSLRRWLTNLHRSLFLGDGGRWMVATGALAMLLLALSGAVLVARRTGGWRRWFYACVARCLAACTPTSRAWRCWVSCCLR